jgi:heat shock protein HtpX
MNPEVWHRHAHANRLQSLLLLGAMGGLLALIGWLLWGSSGLLLLVLAGAVLLALYPVVAPELVMRMYRAERLSPGQAPAFHSALTELARRAGLPARPTLYYIPSAMVNAFAVGTRERAAIALTDGLLRTLETRETVGVLAHEMSHIASNDLRVMAIADVVSRFTSTLSLFGQVLLLVNLPLILLYDQAIHWGVVLLLIFAPNLRRPRPARALPHA